MRRLTNALFVLFLSVGLSAAFAQESGDDVDFNQVPLPPKVNMKLGEDTLLVMVPDSDTASCLDEVSPGMFLCKDLVFHAMVVRKTDKSDSDESPASVKNSKKDSSKLAKR